MQRTNPTRSYHSIWGQWKKERFVEYVHLTDWLTELFNVKKPILKDKAPFQDILYILPYRKKGYWNTDSWKLQNALYQTKDIFSDHFDC